MFSDGPKSGAIGFVMPIDRSIGAQPFILIPGMSMFGEVLGINEIDNWGHCWTPWYSMGNGNKVPQIRDNYLLRSSIFEEFFLNISGD